MKIAFVITLAVLLTMTLCKETIKSGAESINNY